MVQLNLTVYQLISSRRHYWRTRPPIQPDHLEGDNIIDNMNVNPNDQPNPDAQVAIDQECLKRIESASLSRDTYRIEGACPKCNHHTLQDQPVGIVYGLRTIEKKRLPKLVG